MKDENDIRRWWNGMNTERRTAAIHTIPELVDFDNGNLNGTPYEDLPTCIQADVLLAYVETGGH